MMEYEGDQRDIISHPRERWLSSLSHPIAKSLDCKLKITNSKQPHHQYTEEKSEHLKGDFLYRRQSEYLYNIPLISLIFHHRSNFGLLSSYKVSINKPDNYSSYVIFRSLEEYYIDTSKREVKSDIQMDDRKKCFISMSTNFYPSKFFHFLLWWILFNLSMYSVSPNCICRCCIWN